MKIIDLNQFKGYPYLKVTNVKMGSPEIYSLDGIVSDLHRNYDEKTSHFLAELVQKQVPVYHANSLIETIWGRIQLVEITAAENGTVVMIPFVDPIGIDYLDLSLIHI